MLINVIQESSFTFYVFEEALPLRFPSPAYKCSVLKQARVVLYTGGKIVKEVKLNARGSDKLNWFATPRLIDSSWNDMKSQPKNVFSIPGLHNRNFFINRNYGGCPRDAGWMTITGQDCDWERRFNPRQNVIIYSKLQGYTNWNHYGKASTL